MDKKITTIFTDIGNVLLTNGWGRESRQLAAKTFNLDLDEMHRRHVLTFDTYELGKLTLDEYLDRIVFYEKRSFTKKQFRQFMFDQSKKLPEMIELISDLKKKYNLKIAVVSNEGRELNAYRIEKFGLAKFVDFFISSSFVHFRKPDTDIFRVALDIAQVDPAKTIYLEDQPMFVAVARSLGIMGIHHENVELTKKQLEAYGLRAS
jgi:putative hydrolase of the HAD superfamily